MVYLINAAAEKALHIGKQGENLATRIDFSAFAEECRTRFGTGTLVLAHERAEDGAPYAIMPTEGRYWDVLSSDLQHPGTGWLEATYVVGNVVKKSLRWKTVTLSALGETIDPPEAWQSYIERVTQLVDGVYNMSVSAHEADTPTVTKSVDASGRVNLDFGIPSGGGGTPYDDTELRRAIAGLEADKADRSEIPDISNLATKAELSVKADKSEIPDISGLATKTETGALKADLEDLSDVVDGKQDTLESGQNIKTINGESVLGEGNIVIQGGGGGGEWHTAIFNSQDIVNNNGAIWIDAGDGYILDEVRLNMIASSDTGVDSNRTIYAGFYSSSVSATTLQVLRQTLAPANKTFQLSLIAQTINASGYNAGIGYGRFGTSSVALTDYSSNVNMTTICGQANSVPSNGNVDNRYFSLYNFYPASVLTFAHCVINYKVRRL